MAKDKKIGSRENPYFPNHTVFLKMLIDEKNTKEGLYDEYYCNRKDDFIQGVREKSF